MGYQTVLSGLIAVLVTAACTATSLYDPASAKGAQAASAPGDPGARATCQKEVHPPVIATDPQGRRFISFSVKQICPNAQLQHVCVRGRERNAAGTWVALTVKVCEEAVAFDLIAQVQVSCADAGHGTYRTRGWASTWSTSPVLLPDSPARTLC